MNTLRTWPRVDAFDFELNLCFTDSRRLPGPNRFTGGAAAILTTAGPDATDANSVQRWHQVAGALVAELGWQCAEPLTCAHAKGVELVIPCPPDRLYTATEINEFAWEVGCGVGDLDDNFQYAKTGFDVHQRFRDGREAREYFRIINDAEREPALNTIRRLAAAHDVPMLVDDDEFSLGEGACSLTWPLDALPPADAIAWHTLSAIPVALVTGSNGKTTTTRLIAAMLHAASEKFKGRVGLTCTEGVLVGGEWKHRGDYSGPAGARVVLRDHQVAAAVLETARGGILRRGIAVERADVAVVTNVSADHFGEYGVDTLEDLVDVKLAVARTLGRDGTLVLNADDALLLARGASRAEKLALFALDDTHAALSTLRARGGTTCGVADGHLLVSAGEVHTDLGAVNDMPLTLAGAAHYNIANIAAASLAAAAMGIAPSIIAQVLARFGQDRHDNPGRLNRWQLGDVAVIVDYAHNPDGLAALLAGSRSLQVPGQGRIGLLLGQAGNRDDDAIAELASTAAGMKPDFIVIKEIPAMLRGRAMGEIPALLARHLSAAGFPGECTDHVADEAEAACRLLRWAKPGDVVVLPIHQSATRRALGGMLDQMEKNGWRAGQAVMLPPR